MARIVPIKFAEEHLQPIHDGDKTVTARVGWSQPVEEGDQLAIQDTDGRPVTIAEVTRVERMTVEEFVHAEIHGHRQYESVSELLDELRGYYLDRQLSERSSLTVIWFEVSTDESGLLYD